MTLFNFDLKSSFLNLVTVFIWRGSGSFPAAAPRTGIAENHAYVLWKGIQSVCKAANKKHKRLVCQKIKRKVIFIPSCC